MIQTSRHSGTCSTSRKCCETHVRKSSAEERFNTSGSQEALQQVQLTDKPVKDKNGIPLKATEEQLERLVEHFEELLNRPTPETAPGPAGWF